jgi:hypothetical protein
VNGLLPARPIAGHAGGDLSRRLADLRGDPGKILPHDGLRHTAISAFVSCHGSFADAAMQFGNSESMIRTHYFNRMTKAEAEAFYAIIPGK